MYAFSVRLLCLLNTILCWTLLALLSSLFLLCLASKAKNRFIHNLYQQLMSFLSEENHLARIKAEVSEFLYKDAPVKSLEEIRGIRSFRGLQVIEQAAREVDSAGYHKLRSEISSPWFDAYIRKVLSNPVNCRTLLTVKIIGVLRLDAYTSDVVQLLSSCREDPTAQETILIALCNLNAHEELVYLFRDSTLRLTLSFRSVNELFTHFWGDWERFCRELINTASDPYIRRICIKQVGEKQLSPLAPMVRPYLFHDNINIRIDAILSLGNLKDKYSVPRIVNQITDDRWEVRSASIKALAAIDAAAHIDLFILRLCDREWWVRSNAAEVLVQLVDEKSLLEQVLKLNDRFAGEMIRFTLGKHKLDHLKRKGEPI